MKNFILLLVFISIYLSTAARAEVCPEINLYHSNRALNELKIELQGDMNTCYAHSLAVNYNIRFSTDPSDILEPYWIAFLHKDKYLHWNPKDMDFSFLAWAYKDLKKFGRCENRLVQESILKFKNGTNYTHDQFFFLLKTYFKLKGKKNLNADKYWKTLITNLEKKLKKKTKKFTYPWNKEEILKVLTPIRKTSNKISFFTFLNKNIFKSCIENKFPITKNLFTYGMKNEDNFLLKRRTEGFLKQGKPVSIGHCPDVIYDPGALNKKNLTRMPRLLKALSPKCGAHYAVLVGSRTSHHKCQYLLRNTYGKGYWADKTFECFCENNKTKRRYNCQKENFNPKTTTVLGCWIDGERLFTNTYELDAFI